MHMGAHLMKKTVTSLLKNQRNLSTMITNSFSVWEEEKSGLKLKKTHCVWQWIMSQNQPNSGEAKSVEMTF